MRQTDEHGIHGSPVLGLFDLLRSEGFPMDRLKYIGDGDRLNVEDDNANVTTVSYVEEPDAEGEPGYWGESSTDGEGPIAESVEECARCIRQWFEPNAEGTK